jgi:heptosyltransferase-2
MKKILIVKHGALGDVVRTSYFVKSIKEENEGIEIDWYTSKLSFEILSKNHYIDRVVTDDRLLSDNNYDIIYSLDDEFDIIKSVMELNGNLIVGAYLENNNIYYSQDSSEWFDMGLLSKHGKIVADKLKKDNKKSHSEIFKKIFNVSSVEPFFPIKFDPIENKNFKIGINPYAGGRWRSKELATNELKELVSSLSAFYDEQHIDYQIFLFGAGKDRLRNLELFSESEHLIIANTDNSIMDLAREISCLDFLITSDSLAMHLAIAQRIKFLAFFSATSSVEIDTFELGTKIISLASDYCSYKKDADNSSITAERIMRSFIASIGYD